jgi:hypothetical protein
MNWSYSLKVGFPKTHDLVFDYFSTAHNVDTKVSTTIGNSIHIYAITIT